MKVYKEEQHYRSVYTIGALGLFAAACGFLSFRELLWNTSTNWLAVSISLGISLLTILGIRYLIQFKLKTAISTKSISVKMSPLQVQKKKIKLKDIESYQIVSVSPWAEWHGANISFGSEYYYSFTGRNGVLINTKDGEQYFIGSKRLDEFAAALKQVLG
jgi:hypothetical protein